MNRDEILFLININIFNSNLCLFIIIIDILSFLDCLNTDIYLSNEHFLVLGYYHELQRSSRALNKEKGTAENVNGIIV